MMDAYSTQTSLQQGVRCEGTSCEILKDVARFDRAKRFVIDGLTTGKLKPIIAKTFPLEHVVEAHQFMESNQQFGKIIVTV